MSENLAHHGILGMKWGVRRTQEELGHVPTGKKKGLSGLLSRSERKALKKSRKAPASSLTDEELRNRINRLNMEETYENLLAKQKGRHESPAKKLLGDEKASTELDFKIDSYTKIQTALTDVLTDQLGGYIRVRYEDGVRYLDYIQDYGRVNTQPIRIGHNIVDKNDHVSGENLFTVFRPLGKDGLTIEGASSRNLYSSANLTSGRYLDAGQTELIKDSRDWCYLAGYMDGA